MGRAGLAGFKAVPGGVDEENGVLGDGLDPTASGTTNPKWLLPTQQTYCPNPPTGCHQFHEPLRKLQSFRERCVDKAGFIRWVRLTFPSLIAVVRRQKLRPTLSKCQARKHSYFILGEIGARGVSD